MMTAFTPIVAFHAAARSSHRPIGRRSHMAAPICQAASAGIASEGGLMLDTGSMSTPTMLRG